MEILVYYLLVSSVCFFVAWRIEHKEDFTNLAFLLVYIAGPFILAYQAYTRRKILENTLKAKIPKKLRFEWKK